MELFIICCVLGILYTIFEPIFDSLGKLKDSHPLIFFLLIDVIVGLIAYKILSWIFYMISSNILKIAIIIIGIICFIYQLNMVTGLKNKAVNSVMNLKDENPLINFIAMFYKSNKKISKKSIANNLLVKSRLISEDSIIQIIVFNDLKILGKATREEFFEEYSTKYSEISSYLIVSALSSYSKIKKIPIEINGYKEDLYDSGFSGTHTAETIEIKM